MIFSEDDVKKAVEAARQLLAQAPDMNELDQLFVMPAESFYAEVCAFAKAAVRQNSATTE